MASECSQHLHPAAYSGTNKSWIVGMKWFLVWVLLGFCVQLQIYNAFILAFNTRTGALKASLHLWRYLHATVQVVKLNHFVFQHAQHFFIEAVAGFVEQCTCVLFRLEVQGCFAS